MVTSILKVKDSNRHFTVIAFIILIIWTSKKIHYKYILNKITIQLQIELKIALFSMYSILDILFLIRILL